MCNFSPILNIQTKAVYFVLHLQEAQRAASANDPGVMISLATTPPGTPSFTHSQGASAFGQPLSVHVSLILYFVQKPPGVSIYSITLTFDSSQTDIFPVIMLRQRYRAMCISLKFLLC